MAGGSARDCDCADRVIVRVRAYVDPTPAYAMELATLLRWQASNALRSGDRVLFSQLAGVASDYCMGSFK